MSIQTSIILLIVIICISLGIYVVILVDNNNKKTNTIVVLAGNCNMTLPDAILCTVNSGQDLYFKCDDNTFLFFCNQTCVCWKLTNSTLTITCPFDYYGTSLNNATTPNVSGNAVATTNATNACGNVTISYSDKVDPILTTKKRKTTEKQQKLVPYITNMQKEDDVMVRKNKKGKFMGRVDSLPNLQETTTTTTKDLNSRSQSFPFDYTSKVGIFDNTFVVNISSNLAGRVGYPSLETDATGTFRYFTHIGYQMNRISQHDYYNTNPSIDLINPGIIFAPSSECYMSNTWTNTSHYPRQIRYDALQNVFYILYIPLFQDDTARTICIVRSNGIDIKNDGAQAYAVTLPFTARCPDRFSVGLINTTIQFCFDALEEPYAPFTGTNGPFPGVARFGNCFVVNKLNHVEICSAELPGLQSAPGGSYYQNSTINPLHIPTTSSYYSIYPSVFQMMNITRDFIYQIYRGNVSNYFIINYNTCMLGTSPIVGGVFLSMINNKTISNNYKALKNNIEISLDVFSQQTIAGTNTFSPYNALSTFTANVGPGLDSVIVVAADDENKRGVLSLPGISLFGSTPLILPDDTVIISFQQYSTNSSKEIPSTYFAYRLRTDPSGQYRIRESNVIMNGLSNAGQQMSLQNRTNLLTAGICAPQNKAEFSIMGMGNSSAPGVYNMIHQNFIINGEHITRTFTASTNCESITCAQDIYLPTTSYTGP